MNATQANPRRRERCSQLRFDPVTVGAAARILRLAEQGAVPAYEVDYYLRELAESPVGDGEARFQALRRLARRRAEHSESGLRRPFRLQRRAGRVRVRAGEEARSK